MKKLLFIFILAPLFGLSQKYMGLVVQLEGIQGQVIMADEKGDTTHVWPSKIMPRIDPETLEVINGRIYVKPNLVGNCPEWMVDTLDTKSYPNNFEFTDFDRKKKTLNLFKLWESYVTECNRLVSDTIKESGIVTYKTFPIKYKGKVISYEALPIDTIWNKTACNNYKINTSSYWTNGTVLSWSGTGTSYRVLLDSTTLITRSIVEQEVISRNKVCQIKLRKATFDDFWDRWLVEKEIIQEN